MTSRKQSLRALHAEAMSCGSNNAYHAMESRSFAVNFWVASESVLTDVHQDREQTQ